MECAFCGTKCQGEFCSPECKDEYNEEALSHAPVDDIPGESRYEEEWEALESNSF